VEVWPLKVNYEGIFSFINDRIKINVNLIKEHLNDAKWDF